MLCWLANTANVNEEMIVVVMVTLNGYSDRFELLLNKILILIHS